MKKSEYNPAQDALPGLEEFEPKPPKETPKPKTLSFSPEDASAVNFRYPLLRLIGMVNVRSRTEGSQKAHRSDIHSSEEAQKQLEDLETEATELIFNEGKWQEAIDSGVVSKEEVNDLMLELYEYLYEKYTGSENKYKREKMRKFLKGE